MRRSYSGAFFSTSCLPGLRQSADVIAQVGYRVVLQAGPLPQALKASRPPTALYPARRPTTMSAPLQAGLQLGTMQAGPLPLPPFPPQTLPVHFSLRPCKGPLHRPLLEAR